MLLIITFFLFASIKCICFLFFIPTARMILQYAMLSVMTLDISGKCHPYHSRTRMAYVLTSLSRSSSRAEMIIINKKKIKMWDAWKERKRKEKEKEKEDKECIFKYLWWGVRSAVHIIIIIMKELIFTDTLYQNAKEIRKEKEIQTPCKGMKEWMKDIPTAWTIIVSTLIGAEFEFVTREAVSETEGHVVDVLSGEPRDQIAHVCADHTAKLLIQLFVVKALDSEFFLRKKKRCEKRDADKKCKSQ